MPQERRALCQIRLVLTSTTSVIVASLVCDPWGWKLHQARLFCNIGIATLCFCKWVPKWFAAGRQSTWSGHRRIHRFFSYSTMANISPLLVGQEPWLLQGQNPVCVFHRVICYSDRLRHCKYFSRLTVWFWLACFHGLLWRSFWPPCHST